MHAFSLPALLFALDLFGDEMPSKPKSKTTSQPSKDIGPPVAEPLTDQERIEPPIYCPTCGSGELYLPCVGDVTGRTLAGWRCRKCWPDKTDRAMEQVERVRLKARYYGVRIRKEDFTPELDEE